MFLQFSVNNFKSIKDTATLSMNIATKDKGNNISVKNYKILTSAILYGGNATGKSNFLNAIVFMKKMVLNKHRIMQSTDVLPHFPYKLSTETEEASSLFEMVFFINETKYRYGFEADETKFYSEWLFQALEEKEVKLLYRDIDETLLYVNPEKFKEGLGLKTLDNHLFIWKCDQEGGKIAAAILHWFNHLNLVDGSENANYVNFSAHQINYISSFLKVADLGIDGIHLENNQIEQKFKTQHKKFNRALEHCDEVTFSFDDEESMGTKKFFFISAPILDTLKEGKVLLIDEFGASLHPILTKVLIKIFNNNKINRHNAQLIFVTHDTNMLDNALFRKDQIWFIEKDYYGATKLYSLIEYKKIRKNENIEKNYLQGKYGGIPFLNNLDLFQKEDNNG